MMNYLAVAIPPQVGGFTSFLHTVPALVTYLISLGLFLVLAKSEKLGGLAFRHVLIALAYGLLGAAMLPAAGLKTLDAITIPSHRIVAFLIFLSIIALEVFMIIRDRRNGGGE